MKLVYGDGMLRVNSMFVFVVLTSSGGPVMATVNGVLSCMKLVDESEVKGSLAVAKAELPLT